jgi:hypothetical protein
MKTDLEHRVKHKNKVEATGSLAVRVLRYSFGISDWRQEIQKLERKTREMLTVYGQHHLRTNTDLLYVLRKDGGRGLMQAERAYIVEVMKWMDYAEGKEDPLIQIVRTRLHNTNPALFQ